MHDHPQKITMKHSGFQVKLPVTERMLRTSIKVLPAHIPGEDVTPFPGEWQAVWDTGAQSSLISIDLASKLNLPRIGDRRVNGVGGVYNAPEYLAGLVLPNDVIINTISLYGFVGTDKLNMLIGMDIISLGDFLVSTDSKILHFSFQMPSVGGFYIQDIQKAKLANGVLLSADQTIRRTNAKPGRNDPCSCGSGKKYKYCCGRNI